MTLVFFFPKPIRASRRELFQLDRLEKEGYNIVVLDATKYYDKTNKFPQPRIYHRTIDCATREDFVNFAKTLPNEPVLFITSDLYVNSASPVFKSLIRKNDKLLAYKTKAFSNGRFSENKTRLFLEKIIRNLDKHFALHFFNFYYKRKYGILIPDYYLFSTKYIIPVKIYLTVKKQNRFVIHNDDYNLILNPEPSIIDNKKKIGVFVDQAIPFAIQTHPQLYKKEDLPKDYVENYYENIEKSLFYLQEKLNLDEIVIALHPNSNNFKKELVGKFANFRTFSGKTMDLIRDASIIFTHNSTALSYAVIFEKPVIIFKDEFVMGEKIKKGTCFFLNDLDMRGFYIDREFEEISNNDIKINKKRYKEYTQNFIKDNNIQENSYYYAISKIKQELK
ncbi:hypothetical protein SAMN05660776_0767 [Salegentibacter holothuriorum]|uniref:Uncharacterized protein n=1 Tax=Salegentibacter holothuriorum TaxID=241145 RepID=A0A1T5APE9_9FLAO|nr:hypothetical protein [Salegentibacter holothuriorum]SKB36904.1 hypothetical protein SAMN05660776_0767 [Salegentibacter holothuriorum]